jgi:Domain of unknown function (DUF4406)
VIPRIYIAGPFSYTPPAWSRRWPWLHEKLRRRGVERNIRIAELFGIEVARYGYYPVIPHANTAHPEFETVQPYEWWIQVTKESLRSCDGVLLIPFWARSSGAKGELTEANRLRIPAAVAFHLDEVPESLESLGLGQ